MPDLPDLGWGLLLHEQGPARGRGGLPIRVHGRRVRGVFAAQSNGDVVLIRHGSNDDMPDTITDLRLQCGAGPNNLRHGTSLEQTEHLQDFNIVLFARSFVSSDRSLQLHASRDVS